MSIRRNRPHHSRHGCRQTHPVTTMESDLAGPRPSAVPVRYWRGGPPSGSKTAILRTSGVGKADIRRNADVCYQHRRCGAYLIAVGLSRLFGALRAQRDPLFEPNQARLFGKQVLRHVVDDIAQPRMPGLVVKPSRPDHGSFDRFGRTRQPMESEVVRLDHTFGDVERKHRYQVRCRQNLRS